MVPQKIIIINSDFPRNRNGKIDTNKFIDSNKIFKEIDQMPMRIEEMKNR